MIVRQKMFAGVPMLRRHKIRSLLLPQVPEHLAGRSKRIFQLSVQPSNLNVLGNLTRGGHFIPKEFFFALWNQGLYHIFHRNNII